ncbi:MAG: ferritin [Coprobacillaceae bacterium]
MLDKKIVEAINKQINRELHSEYLYLHFANYYIDEGLEGFGNWFNVQVQEERSHAMLFIEYLQNNSEKVILEEIAKPIGDFKNYFEPLEASLKHECYITKSINDIYEIAYNLKDFRTMQFLDWFIKEQGEEEKNADDLITKFKLFGHDAKALYELDKELATRVYTAPTLTL